MLAAPVAAKATISSCWETLTVLSDVQPLLVLRSLLFQLPQGYCEQQQKILPMYASSASVSYNFPWLLAAMTSDRYLFSGAS